MARFRDQEAENSSGFTDPQGKVPKNKQVQESSNLNSLEIK